MFLQYPSSLREKNDDAKQCNDSLHVVMKVKACQHLSIIALIFHDFKDQKLIAAIEAKAKTKTHLHTYMCT